MNIQIKKAEKIYLSQIVELLQVISNFYPDQNIEKNNWESFINQKGVYGYIAIDSYVENFDKQLVGFGTLHLSRKVRGGVIGFIEDIAITENYRGKGIGKLILKNLIRKAKEESCYKLVLECKENKLGFYEKIGFKKSGFSMSLIL
tara:strand:+ start:4001 stop:4438 length:438 start_codon:yes stop_codon:yes gene_type:complete